MYLLTVAIVQVGMVLGLSKLVSCRQNSLKKKVVGVKFEHFENKHYTSVDCILFYHLTLPIVSGCFPP